jgi:hypothetical protein
MKDSFDKQFEDMLRDKLNQKEFELKDHYWLEARKLIDNERKNRRRGFFIIPVFILCLLSSIVAVIFTTSKQPGMSAPDHQAPAVSRLAETHIISAIPLPTDHANPVKSTTITPSRASESTAPSGNKNTAIQEDKKTLDHPVTRSMPPSHAAGTPEYVSLRVPSAQHTGTTLPGKRRNKQPEKDMRTLFTHTSNENSILPVKMRAVKNIYEIESWDLAPLSLRIKICDTCIRSYAFYQNMHRPEKQKHFMAIEAGITGFNPSSRGSNFNVTGGIGYYQFLHKRCYIRSGIFYSRIHQNLDDITFENITYTFGKIVDRTVIKTLSLDYMEIPVHVSYAVYRNHFITSGVTLARVINSSNILTRQKGGDNSTQSIQDNGYTFAVNPYDVQLNIGYTFLSDSKLIASAMYGYGILDISNNQSFRTTTFDRNTGIRIYMAYKLFK